MMQFDDYINELGADLLTAKNLIGRFDLDACTDETGNTMILGEAVPYIPACTEEFNLVSDVSPKVTPSLDMEGLNA